MKQILQNLGNGVTTVDDVRALRAGRFCIGAAAVEAMHAGA